MKIFLTSYFFAPSIGGIESVSLMLAREFVAAGHEVCVATRTPDPSATDYGFEIVRQPTFSQLVARTRWCDVLFQNNISLDLAVGLLAVRRPWVVTHQTWIEVTPGPSGFSARAKRWLLRRAQAISISRAVAESMPTESVLIPNPYDDAVFYPRGDINRKGDLVGFGRLVSDKGFNLLISAMAHLAEVGLRPSLSIIGEGLERASLEKQARDLGVAGQVTFLGAMRGSTLAEELHRHRIAVIPSRWKEPFGIVALEAAACGCVVVGSAEGGLADAIGPCGTTFPNGDDRALAQVLSTLLKKPDLLVKYREHAAAHLAGHTASSIAKDYLKVFASVR